MTEEAKTVACVINHPGMPIPGLPADRPLNPRNTEGDIIELNDGRLLLAYSHYYVGGADHDPADIRGRISSDGGRTWSDDYVIQANNGLFNVMSASLVRMHTGKNVHPAATALHDKGIGPIGLAYIRTNAPYESCIVFKTSYDEGIRWSEERPIHPSGCYYSIGKLNSVAVVLSCGRIVIPVTVGVQGKTSYTTTYYSDDGGWVWQRSKSDVCIRLAGRLGAAIFCEPTVVELHDGRLMMIGRNITGRLWKSHSTDRGDTWCDPVPMNLAASASPSPVVRIPTTGDLLLVWNQASADEIVKGLGRSRLSTAISTDAGETWGHFRNLESIDDRSHIEPPPLGDVFDDTSEQTAITARTFGEASSCQGSRKELPDVSDYPYAGNSKERVGYGVAEYPSITFLSDSRVALSYDTWGGHWNLEGPQRGLGLGTWINEGNLPGLIVRVMPLDWFYQ